MIRCALVFSLLVSASAAAQESVHGKLVAVLEFNTKLEGTEKKAVDVQYLADTVRAAVLDALPELRVMTRENELVLLEQSGKKLAECEGECEVDTGRRLGADLVISGDLLRFGSSFKLNLKLHETRDGRLLAGAQASGRTIDELDAATGIAVRKLLKPLIAQSAQGQAGEQRQADEREAQRQQQAEQRQAGQRQADQRQADQRQADERRTAQRENAQRTTPTLPSLDDAPAAPQRNPARGPRLAIGTSTSKTLAVSVRAGGKTFKCPNPVTETALCELYGVPTGAITLIVQGDLNEEREFTFRPDGLHIRVDTRSRWPTYTGLGLLAGGSLLLLAGTQATPGSEGLLYAYGGLLGAGGLVFLIFGLARSHVTYDETTGEAFRDVEGGKVRLAGLGLAPVQGGALASAAFRF